MSPPPTTICRSLIFHLIFLTTGLLFCGLQGLANDFHPPMKTEINGEHGRGVQRTLRRLEESTPTHKNTVRILFYGQSITEQAWAKQVTEDLKKRYPNANLIVENRAIGGFSSILLVMTSESDLYPFYPDLLVFYDFGRHDCYEDMIRRTRERTTSEILLQTDHATKLADLDEETDPAKVTMKTWSSWFPNIFIPSIAKKYQTGMVEQRALWKLYAREQKIDPRSLTIDGAHLNDQGNLLMSTLINAYLIRKPEYDDPTVVNQIRDYLAEKDWTWTDNQLSFPFTGNKIDIIAAPDSTGSAEVLIDGKKPSDLPELYQTSRVSGYPGIGWPIISQVEHEKPLILEEWTATTSGFSEDGKHFKFTVEGSITGKDGEGTSDNRFVSNSGRVVIEPKAWNMAYSFGLLQGAWAKDKNKHPFVMPDKIVAKWKVTPFFLDHFQSPKVEDPAVETLVTLAQGLSNGPHLLQLTRNGPLKIVGLRVYQPPLKSVENKETHATEMQNVPQFAPPMRKTGN